MRHPTFYLELSDHSQGAGTSVSLPPVSSQLESMEAVVSTGIVIPCSPMRTLFGLERSSKLEPILN